jgi:uncharacterized RDD family membrane protein YckC
MYCSRCGVQIGEGSQYCPACGQPAGFSPTNAPVVPQPFSGAASAPSGFGDTISPGIPPPRIGYAGFWLRFVAIIIDGIIIEVVLGIPFFLLLGGAGILRAMMSGNPPEDYLAQFFGAIALFSLAAFVARWFYFALFESSSWQATPGKRALGLYVTDLAGQRISFGRASGRFFGKIVSSLTLMIGYIMAGFTERKQALHDMIAGTLVLRKL